MARIWAENSYCQRRQVGALVVKDKMIISDGYNGTPSGFENVCEDENNVSKPYVLHAEANAITKLARSSNNSDGATIYITASPCIECAKLIIQAGIKRVVYGEKYRLTDGIELLERAGIEVVYLAGNRLSIINTGSNKLNNLLHIVDDQYVDTVDVNDLVEKAMPQILSELDPHSVYISAKDVQIANDDLRGSFSGVGIEFTIRQDTLRVQNVITDGPAEQAGMQAGDKIVTVDDSAFTGKTLTNEEAMHRLKGPKDTKVKLGILRYGEQKLRHITVTRGEIPMKSVTAAYMLDDETGYIKHQELRREHLSRAAHRAGTAGRGGLLRTWSSTCAATRAAIWHRPCR